MGPLSTILDVTPDSFSGASSSSTSRPTSFAFFDGLGAKLGIVADERSASERQSKITEDVAEIESQIRTMKRDQAETEMAGQAHEAELLRQDYLNAEEDFRAAWDDFVKDRGTLNRAYVEVKKTYFGVCKPLEEKYKMHMDCTDDYQTAISQFIARRGWPQCRVGRVGVIPLKNVDENGWFPTFSQIRKFMGMT